MRGSLLLASAALLANATFAQSAKPTFPTERPPVATTTAPANASPSNYQFHAQFGAGCCSSDFGFVGAPDSVPGSAPNSANAVAPAAPRFAYAAGGPNFQPSNYVPFRDAVAEGDEQAANAPFKQSKDATVQQMLDLIHATRAAEQQNYDEEGSSAPVKWADLQPGINPADYLKPPSTYMKYKDAVALGKAQQQEKTQQPPSLGEVASEASESRPAGTKPAVVVRQDADGTPRVINNDQLAPDQSPAQNSKPD
jgi:hypothetical protein